MRKKKKAASRMKKQGVFSRIRGWIGLGVVAVLVSVLCALGIYYYFLSSSPQSKLISTRVYEKLGPTSTPKPIPHGKIDFNVSGGNDAGPTIGKGFIDPYDPPLHGEQSVSVDVMSKKSPVLSVVAILSTDLAVSSPYQFQRIAGTEIKGTWKGSWKVDDTYLHTYRLAIIAKSADGESRIDITLR